MNNRISNYRFFVKQLDSKDIIDHFEFSYMPMKMILDFPLFTFNKPVTNAEIVISNLLT